ncbi:MAG: hypothetical protein AAF392_00570, partial [Bacteroidota bacterium]
MSSTAYPIDVGIFVGFLAINLMVGLSYGRRVKDLKTYALGGKNFSTGTLTATIVATWMGGDTIFYTVTNVYKGGLYFIIPILGWIVCVILTGQLAIRMGEFLQNVSVAEVMRDLYGKSVHIITATFGILSCIGCIAIQLKVTSIVITLIWGFTGHWVTVIAGIIVISYSALGGIKAVTFTDVVQFLTFGTFIPIIALVIWNNLEGHDKVIDTLTHTPIFDFAEIVRWDSKFISSIALLLFFMIPGIDPATFQRIAMAHNIRQVKQAFTYAAVPFLLILLFMIWISILLLSTDTTLPPDDLVGHIIDQYAYPGLRGLLGIGIVAMAMSTSDSYINSSAVLFSNDIAKPLNITIQSPIRTARLFACLWGILALMLALHTDDLLELALLPGSFYMPIVTVPLIMAVFGFRSSTRAVLIGMILGFVSALSWRIFLDQTDINIIAPGMLANLIGLVGTHYLLGEKGGWQQTDPSSPLGLARVARKKAWIRRIEAVKNFRLYPYLQQNLPKQEYFYFLFGLYTIAATYAAFYTVGENATATYEPIYKGIYHTVLVATTVFLTFPVWPPVVKSERFITFFWPFGICAILFFAGTLLVIMSHFHIMQVMVLMSNLLVAVLLLRWPLALMLAASGVVLATLFFKQYTGLVTLPGDLGSLQFRIIYGLLLFSSFLIALFKHKQAYKHLEDRAEQLTSEQEATSTELVEALHHRERFAQEMSSEGVEVFNTVHELSEKLAQEVRQAEASQPLTAASETLKVASQKLKSAATYLDQVTSQVKSYMHLEVSTVCLEEELYNLFETLDRHDLELRDQVIIKKYTRHKELQCDVAKVRQLLVKSICYTQGYNKDDKPILLGIEDAI